MYFSSNKKLDFRQAQSSGAQASSSAVRSLDSPLDLSSHKFKTEELSNDDRASSSGRTSVDLANSEFDPSKRRTHADASLVRVPLSLG